MRMPTYPITTTDRRSAPAEAAPTKARRNEGSRTDASRNETAPTRAARTKAVHPLTGVALLLMLASGSAWAGTGRAVFDVPPTLAVADLTGETCAATPHLADGCDRIVELRVPISVRFDSASEQELVTCQFELTCLSGLATVVDYEPKTAVEPRVEGDVEVSRGDEHSASLGLTAGPVPEVLRTTATTSLGNRQNTSIKYRIQAPMRPISAAGTIHRARGVYYKLRPSPRRSLEGGHEFVVRLRVRPTWRTDLLLIRCAAMGVRDGGTFGSDTVEVWGRADFQVPLYEAGDADARNLADQYVTDETTFRRLASTTSAATHGRNPASLFRQVGSILDFSGPELPAGWMTRVVFAPREIDEPVYARRLPAEVFDAATRLKQSRVNLLTDREPVEDIAAK